MSNPVVTNNLIVLTKDNLDVYVEQHPDDFSFSWERRDFVPRLLEFTNFRRGAIKLISGLRGTGKTVGLMQLIKETDALYIRCLEKGQASMAEIYELINQSPERTNIFIDEFTWIKEMASPTTEAQFELRNAAERSIVALSERGKNIILTGTESASLEAIKARGFIHRTADTEHVTRFSFEEFRRIYKQKLPKRPQEIYDMYLKEGGIFEDYAKQSVGGMDEYIRNSIVENIYSYIGNDTGFTRRKIASGVYTVLFKAVHDILNTSIPGDDFTERAKANLAALGIPDVTEKLHPRTVERIAETLSNIGVIITVPNVLPRKKRMEKAGILEDDERTYIVNPAISFQLAKTIYGKIRAEDVILGRLMEAAVIVELNALKRPGDKLYFYDSDNGEIDAVIAPEYGEDPVSLFEVKHRFKISSDDIQNRHWSIPSDDVEEQIAERFPDNDIENRYFVYTGRVKSEKSRKNGKTYLFVGIDKYLKRYWDFSGNLKEIRKEYAKTTNNSCPKQ